MDVRFEGTRGFRSVDKNKEFILSNTFEIAKNNIKHDEEEHSSKVSPTKHIADANFNVRK